MTSKGGGRFSQISTILHKLRYVVNLSTEGGGGSKLGKILPTKSMDGHQSLDFEKTRGSFFRDNSTSGSWNGREHVLDGFCHLDKHGQQGRYHVGLRSRRGGGYNCLNVSIFHFVDRKYVQGVSPLSVIK